MIFVYSKSGEGGEIKVVEYNGERDVKSIVGFLDSIGIPISEALERTRDEL